MRIFVNEIGQKNINNSQLLNYWGVAVLVCVCVEEDAHAS